jgi:hypothetical protein
LQGRWARPTTFISWQVPIQQSSMECTSYTYLPARQIYHFMQNFGKFAPFVMATRQSPNVFHHSLFARNTDMEFRGPILGASAFLPSRRVRVLFRMPVSPSYDPLYCSTFVLVGFLRYEGFPTEQQQLLHPRSDYLGDLDPIRGLGRPLGLALLHPGS